MTMDLTDLPDVRNRVRKGLVVLFVIKRGIFSNSKVSRATKNRVACLALVVMVALCGCESWAVTAEIERTLRSFRRARGVSKRRTVRSRHYGVVAEENWGEGCHAFLSPSLAQFSRNCVSHALLPRATQNHIFLDRRAPPPKFPPDLLPQHSQGHGLCGCSGGALAGTCQR